GGMPMRHLDSLRANWLPPVRITGTFSLGPVDFSYSGDIAIFPRHCLRIGRSAPCVKSNPSYTAGTPEFGKETLILTDRRRHAGARGVHDASRLCRYSIHRRRSGA